MTPVGNLSTGSALSAVPLPGNLKPVSPLIPGVALTRSSTPRFLGLDRVATFRSSLFPRAGRANLSSRCEPHVRGVADLAGVTTSCSSGVRWDDADLRHLSRPQAQDSFIAATITSAGPWGTKGTGIAGLRDNCPSPGSAAGRSVFPVRIPQHAWERVNTLPAGRVNDERVGTGPLQGESDLPAGGLDDGEVQAAGCAAGPGG